jgi:proline iminopeptidase
MSWPLRHALAVSLALLASLGSAAGAAQNRQPGPSPAAEGQIEVPGSVLHYTVIGAGRPVLLLAGGPGTPVEYMRPIVAGLGEGYQFILLDQRGTGRSTVDPMDGTTITLDAFVGDVEALREHLQIDRWVLLGHSWGGMLGMAYATRHPTRVEALVLVSSGGPTLAFMDYYFDNQLARLTLEERELFNHWNDPARSLGDPQRAMYERFRAAAPAYVFDRKIAQMMVAGMSPQAVSAQVYDLMMADLEAGQYDLRPALQKLTLPALIVQGRQDPLGASTAFEIRESLPHASLEFIERCGHFPWIEQPQSFLEVVRSFLQGLLE